MNGQMIRLADIGEIFGHEDEQRALHAVIDETRAVFRPWHCIGWSYAGFVGYLTLANLLNISSAAEGQPSSVALVGSIFVGGLACAALAVIGDRYRRGHMREQGKQIAAQLTYRLQRLQAALRSGRITAWCLPHQPSAQKPFELIPPGMFWGPYSEALLSGKTEFARWARIRGKRPRIGEIWVDRQEVEAQFSDVQPSKVADDGFQNVTSIRALTAMPSDKIIKFLEQAKESEPLNRDLHLWISVTLDVRLALDKFPKPVWKHIFQDLAIKHGLRESTIKRIKEGNYPSFVKWFSKR